MQLKGLEECPAPPKSSGSITYYYVNMGRKKYISQGIYWIQISLWYM